MERGVRVNGGDYFNQLDRSTVSMPPSGGAGGVADGDGSVGGGGGVNYIEHPVSKLDTLAGVAIRYGVEVIKRIFLTPSLLTYDRLLFLYCQDSRI